MPAAEVDLLIRPGGDLVQQAGVLHLREHLLQVAQVGPQREVVPPRLQDAIVLTLNEDLAGARDVQLVLPETGVCSTDRGADGCCSPVVAAPAGGVTLELVPHAAAPRLGQGARSVQLVSMPATSDVCCSTTVQSSCCAPEEKADCCGQDTSAGCGCQ